MSILEDINKLIISNSDSVTYKNNCITLPITTSDGKDSTLKDSILRYSNHNITYSDNVLEINLNGAIK